MLLEVCHTRCQLSALDYGNASATYLRIIYTWYLPQQLNLCIWHIRSISLSLPELCLCFSSWTLSVLFCRWTYDGDISLSCLYQHIKFEKYFKSGFRLYCGLSLVQSMCLYPGTWPNSVYIVAIVPNKPLKTNQYLNFQ